VLGNEFFFDLFTCLLDGIVDSFVVFFETGDHVFDRFQFIGEISNSGTSGERVENELPSGSSIAS
jgi:hypothetical protein